jgi:aromatic-L-amino-acid decarboxylase
VSLELSPGDREQLGRSALDWVLKYFEAQSALPVYPTVGPRELSASLSADLPADPQSAEAVMADFEHIVAGSRHNGHPRMFGYVQSAGSFAGVAADFLASALNQNVTSWRSAPSATTIEHQVIDWMKTMSGFAPTAAGILLSGGSMANFAALAVALRASTEIDINQVGVAALGKPRIYASAMTHMSIPKAAAMLGIGRDAVQLIPVDQEFRMDVGELRRRITSDRAFGFRPVCVVGNAGEVNTGAIDPLDAMADVCVDTGVWFHVDGSYGGFAAGAPRVADALSAIGRADSLSLDPHKWLFAPLDAGCLLVRDPQRLKQAFAHGASYVDVIADHDMSEYAYWDHSPELTRRFRALKIWFILKMHGARAIQEAIDGNIAVAQHLAAAIDASGDFERVAPVPLSIVCFRFTAGDDAFNKALMVEVQRDGDAYLSNTMIDGRFALRACIVNYRTTPADAERLLATIRRVAARMGGAV